ncbi:ParB/RepB/Spo0J family partition protein [Siphonobacter aquaeclarae]|jgi:ParB family chromosome partitioning protein|uniref:Chromosome partitioning protein, ParB family n=1 Tax=Siphonobacter aquaeclarae TaxID=563176 RepID=A0A1G9NM21_9BACT|nr:ParB/RepB/Spo0J family partition protein [Siphonobacter aquaeclarae]SDL87656.1 chromosome partitioning protein, ParB family [Siphonobacter aquaeclarae]
MSNANKKRVGLGRGLGALLQDSEAINTRSGATSLTALEQVSSMNEINVNFIEANPFQPRTHFDEDALNELAESIRIQGIIQPITVRQLGRDQYQLISGERRWQASKIAGLSTIPAYIRTADDQQMLEMALIENIQRENLNAMEIAISYQRLITECNLRQEELGERVGKNRTTVNNYIRLLKLPPVIQIALRDNKISMGHARAIINIDDSAVQLNLYNRIVEEDWSVRRVEEEVRKLQNPVLTGEKAKKGPLKQEIRALQFRLSSFFGSKVSIKADDKEKGEIRIPFTNQEDLERILGTLGNLS